MSAPTICGQMRRKNRSTSPIGAFVIILIPIESSLAPSLCQGLASIIYLYRHTSKIIWSNWIKLDQIRSIELTILNLKAPIINQAVIAFCIRLGPLGHTLHCCRRISNLDVDAVGISHVGGERDASNRNQFLLTAPLRNAQDLSFY